MKLLLISCVLFVSAFAAPRSSFEQQINFDDIIDHVNSFKTTWKVLFLKTCVVNVS